MSPKKKKAKITNDNNTKRSTGAEETCSNKRLKSQENKEIIDKKCSIRALKRKNFMTACKRVSHKAYFNYRSRFQLVYLPSCVNRKKCKHQNTKTGEVCVKEMPSYAQESFNIELKSNMWCEALEVCIMSITPFQYLSAHVLRNILEIILNAHEDEYSDFRISYLIDKCQEVLSLNFSTHPPCQIKKLRQCYRNFLASPMDHKQNTFTNREQFGYKDGVVMYCINRLEYEISSESKDGPLIDKEEVIPKEMRESVRGLHWQKEKLDIYELLERYERIERLMAALDIVIELLQFDLAIWHSRHTYNLGLHIMSSHKPLMAFVLWQNNTLYTGTVNNNCRKFLRLFAHLIYLDYPPKYIKILVVWFNTIVQTFYICETNSNCDYPNPGKYCSGFAREFYKIISTLPNETIIKILEWMKPTFIKYLIGSLHIKNILDTNEDDVIINLTKFVKKMQWNLFPESEKTLNIKSQRPNTIKTNKLLSHLHKLCNDNSQQSATSTNNTKNIELPKLDLPNKTNSEVDRNHIIHTFYITLEAYLDTYSIQNVQETLDSLNDLLDVDINSDNNLEFGSYTVTENFIKKCRSIYQLLKQLVIDLAQLKDEGNLPADFTVFENIGLLTL